MAIAATPKIFGRNPDVLDSIANLSNDEVFTPPSFAKQMLDSLEKAWADSNDGADIWEDPTVTFLDPCTKSGVFLREIVARLTKGLEKEIPDLQDRVDHIVTKQVFGIAITQLTSLMARRSVYCSKRANGKHSIAKKFDTEDGNIKFEMIQHDWVGGKTFVETADEDGNPISIPIDGKCRYCGSSRRSLDRGEGLETHAYSFIHTDDSEEYIAQTFGVKMQFDVVIGNPPYQLSDGGGEGSSAIPIYQKFVDQAIALQPRFLSMIIPARWYSGGKGLDDFRARVFAESKILELHDFPETHLVFPGQNIRGGVCYFLWQNDHEGEATFFNYSSTKPVSRDFRPLVEPGLNTLIRYNEAVTIVKKVRHLNERTMDQHVKPRNPFGIPSNFSDFSNEKSNADALMLYRSRRKPSEPKVVWVDPTKVKANLEYATTVRVIVSKASPGGDDYPHAVFSKPLISLPGSVSTETYLIVGFPGTEEEARNLVKYMKTRFFRFLVALVKNSQNISRASFQLVPIQDLSQVWTDDMLYEKYGITENEVAFIESMIRPMELTDDED